MDKKNIFLFILVYTYINLLVKLASNSFKPIVTLGSKLIRAYLKNLKSWLKALYADFRSFCILDTLVDFKLFNSDIKKLKLILFIQVLKIRIFKIKKSTYFDLKSNSFLKCWTKNEIFLSLL